MTTALYIIGRRIKADDDNWQNTFPFLRWNCILFTVRLIL